MNESSLHSAAPDLVNQSTPQESHRCLHGKHQPQHPSERWEREQLLPRPPHASVRAAGLLHCSLDVAVGAEGRRGAGVLTGFACSVEAVEVRERLLLQRVGGQEVQRLLPAVGVAVAVSRATGRALRLQLLLQEHHGHLQDVGLLQLGVGIPFVELLLQQDLELLDAAVDAISAHLLHNWFPQLGTQQEAQSATHSVKSGTERSR